MTLTKKNQSIIPRLTLAALKTGGLAASLMNLDISSAAAEITIQSTGAISGTIELPSFNPNFNKTTTRVDTDSTGTYYRNIGTKKNPNLVPVYSSKFVQFSNNPDGSIKYFVDFVGIPVVSFDGVLSSPALSEGELSSFSYEGKLDGVKFKGAVQDEFTVGKAYYEGIATDPKTGQQYKGKFEINAQGLRYSDAKVDQNTPTVFDFKSDYMPGERYKATPTVTSYQVKNAPLIRVTITIPDNAEVLSTVSPINTSTTTNVNTNTSSNTGSNTNTSSGIVSTGITNSGIGGGIVSSGITNGVSIGSNGTLGTTNPVTSNPTSGITLDPSVTVEPSTFTTGVSIGSNGTLGTTTPVVTTPVVTTPVVTTPVVTTPVVTTPVVTTPVVTTPVVTTPVVTTPVVTTPVVTTPVVTTPVVTTPTSVGITLDPSVTVEPSTFTGSVSVDNNVSLGTTNPVAANPVTTNPSSGVTLDPSVTVEPSTFTGSVSVANNGTLGTTTPVTTNPVSTSPDTSNTTSGGITLDPSVTVEPSTFTGGASVDNNVSLGTTNPVAATPVSTSPDTSNTTSGITLDSVEPSTFTSSVNVDNNGTLDTTVNPDTSNIVSSITLDKGVAVEASTFKDERENTKKDETSNINTEADKIANPERDVTINSIGALDNGSSISFNSGVTSEAEVTPTSKISSNSTTLNNPSSPVTNNSLEFGSAVLDPSGTVKNVNFDNNQPKKVVGPRSRILMR
jgi:hypothetical protein